MSDSTYHDNLDDGELVRRTLAGDKRAGEVLLRRHFNCVRRNFRLNVSDPATADDLTQETMMQGFRGLSTLERPERFRAWLSGIALNKLRDYYRGKHSARHREECVDALSAYDVEGPDAPFQVIADRHEARILVEALRQLPLRTQQLLLYSYWDKLKRTEIAEIFKIPVGTVGSRLSYARKQLHERYAALEFGGKPLRDTTRPLEKWQNEVREPVS